jgi:hypothetical protein
MTDPTVPGPAPAAGISPAPATAPAPIAPGPAKVTGVVESIDDRYVDPLGNGQIVHLTGAIVAFPNIGGGTIGVATNLQGLKVGAPAVLDAQVIASKDGAATTVVQGLVLQTIDVDPFRATITPTTVTPK